MNLEKLGYFCSMEAIILTPTIFNVGLHAGILLGY